MSLLNNGHRSRVTALKITDLVVIGHVQPNWAYSINLKENIIHHHSKRLARKLIDDVG